MSLQHTTSHCLSQLLSQRTISIWDTDSYSLWQIVREQICFKMQQCLAHLQELVSWSLCIRWVSFLLWPDQCWLSIKKLLRIWYRPKPTLHSAATPQFPAQHSEMCRWSHILCPSIYYCILHALLKCSAYCSSKGKNWRKRKNERHTHWNECQVNFLRFLMQCSVSAPLSELD